MVMTFLIITSSMLSFMRGIDPRDSVYLCKHIDYGPLISVIEMGS